MITVAKGKPVTAPIPPCPARPTPLQPPGRAPARRGADTHEGPLAIGGFAFRPDSTPEGGTLPDALLWVPALQVRSAVPEPGTADRAAPAELRLNAALMHDSDPEQIAEGLAELAERCLRDAAVSLHGGFERERHIGLPASKLVGHRRSVRHRILIFDSCHDLEDRSAKILPWCADGGLTGGVRGDCRAIELHGGSTNLSVADLDGQEDLVVWPDGIELRGGDERILHIRYSSNGTTETASYSGAITSPSC